MLSPFQTKSEQSIYLNFWNLKFCNTELSDSPSSRSAVNLHKNCYHVLATSGFTIWREKNLSDTWNWNDITCISADDWVGLFEFHGIDSRCLLIRSFVQACSLTTNSGREKYFQTFKATNALVQSVSYRREHSAMSGSKNSEVSCKKCESSHRTRREWRARHSMQTRKVWQHKASYCHKQMQFST